MNRVTFTFIFFTCFSTPLPACQTDTEQNNHIVVQENGNRKYFGTIGSDTVYAYTLKNNKGLKAVITNYGGTILELWTPIYQVKRVT